MEKTDSTLPSNAVFGANKDQRSPHTKLRQDLRQLLDEHGVRSNPAVSSDWIVDQLKQLLSRRQ